MFNRLEFELLSEFCRGIIPLHASLKKLRVRVFQAEENFDDFVNLDDLDDLIMGDIISITPT